MCLYTSIYFSLKNVFNAFDSGATIESICQGTLFQTEYQPEPDVAGLRIIDRMA